jgi:hypothetical protein
MDQKQINIIQAQTLQAFLQTKLSTRVVGAPQLGSDEDILSLDPTFESFLQTSSNFIFITIAVGYTGQFIYRREAYPLR